MGKGQNPKGSTGLNKRFEFYSKSDVPRWENHESDTMWYTFQKIILASLRNRFEGRMSKDRKIQLEDYSPSKILWWTCLETRQWGETEVNRFEIYFGGKSTGFETINLERRKIKDYSQVSCSGKQPPSWPPIFPTSWYSHPCVTAFHIVIGWSRWSTEYGRSDGMWLPRQGHKRHCRFYLVLSFLGHLLWGKKPYKDAHVAGNWGFLPTSIKELRLLAKIHVRDTAWKRFSRAFERLYLQPISWLQCHDPKPEPTS